MLQSSGWYLLARMGPRLSPRDVEDRLSRLGVPSLTVMHEVSRRISRQSMRREVVKVPLFDTYMFARLNRMLTERECAYANVRMVIMSGRVAELSRRDVRMINAAIQRSSQRVSIGDLVRVLDFYADHPFTVIDADESTVTIEVEMFGALRRTRVPRESALPVGDTEAELNRVPRAA